MAIGVLAFAQVGTAAKTFVRERRSLCEFSMTDHFKRQLLYGGVVGHFTVGIGADLFPAELLSGFQAMTPTDRTSFYQLKTILQGCRRARHRPRD